MFIVIIQISGKKKLCLFLTFCNKITTSLVDCLSILHPPIQRPYKARFIANSSSCTTTELSKLLTSCLTAIKSHVTCIRYCETVYETSNKNWFWSIKKFW